MVHNIKPRGEMTPEELDAARRHDRRKRYLRDTGRPLHITPAEFAKVKARIVACHDQGMAYRQMAELTGIGRHTFGKIVNGTNKSLERANYEKVMRLLEYRPPTADDLGIRSGARMPSVGACRRIIALRAKAFPINFLASYVGVQHQNLPSENDSAFVYFDMDTKVREMYEKLRDVDPWDLVGHEYTASAVRKAENRARRLNIPGPGQWDDDTIDDPEAIPDWTGFCGTEQGYITHLITEVPMCAPCKATVPGKVQDNTAGAMIVRHYRFKPDEMTEAMKRRGMSMNALEELAGVPHGSGYRWLRGDYEPRLKAALRVASILDLLWTDLYERTDECSTQ